MIDDNDSQLRKAERELYTTDIHPPKRRSVLHEEKITPNKDWKHSGIPVLSGVPMHTPQKTTSVFRNIFLTSLGLLVIAVIILGISFLKGGNAISEKNVNIIVTTKSFVDGGESLPVEVTIVNKNKLAMELGTLVLEYPQGNDDNSGATTRIERDLGVIPAGATHQESFRIQLYGAQNSQRNIIAHIQFRVQGLNAVYIKDETVTVTIRTSPVIITLAAPDKTLSNQEIPLKFSIVGNGTATLPNTALIVQYPEGFTFTKAEPAPSYGNTVWHLGDVPPGANRTITIYGSLTGSVTDLKTVRASVGAQSTTNEQVLDTTYNTLAQVIPLVDAFLDARIVVSGQASTGVNVPITGSQQVRITIPWKNTLTVPITNAQVSVAFSGSAYDPAFVQPISGFFDSVNNKIIWTKQEEPSLSTINPGQSGELSFTVRPRVSSGSGSATNPVMKISLDVSGYQTGGIKLTASNIDMKTLAVSSNLNLLVRTTHYTGIIQNTGAMPPAAKKETTYTLEWILTNTLNRVSAATVMTTLPTYVSWKNVVLPASEAANITYNEVTRQLIWNVGDVPAGTTSRILSMKVGITPSIQQVGSSPNLTDSMILTGKDTFTGQDLTITKLPLNTRLLNDGTGAGVDGTVVR